MSDKWKVGNLAIHGYRIYNEQGRDVVSDIYNKEDAEQIVNEHNPHAALVQIARDALQDRVEMNGHCQHDGYMTKLCSQCEIRELLAAIDAEKQSTPGDE